MNPDDLINTETPAPGTMTAVRFAWTSYDYYRMRPYPQHAFGTQQWPLDKGPVPTALPFVGILVDEGADFVFRGGSPQFTVPDSEPANDFLAEIIKRNRMDTRWVSLAKRNGNLGTLAVKWSYDATNEENPIRLSFLSVPEECRVWTDPHDHTRILMARVQYPYRSPVDGKWYYFREEWTDDLWVTYLPKDAGPSSVENASSLVGYADSLGDGPGWIIDECEANEFGTIPIAIIKNRSIEGQVLGEGDCWHSFRLIDRIALTMHGEDRANQMHSEPIPVIKNATLNNTGPLLPGEPIEIQNTNRDGPPADMVLLEPHGNAREFSHKSMDTWKALLYAQVGMSLVDASTVTNKGNMTRAVFEMLYARTIATSNHKRASWGEGGLGPMFSRMLTGLSNLGGVEVGGIKLPRLNAPDVTVNWPDYFEATDDDLSALTDRTLKQVGGGVLSLDRGARRIALREGHPPHEVEAISSEVQAQDEEKKQQAAALAVQAKTPTVDDTPPQDVTNTAPAG